MFKNPLYLYGASDIVVPAGLNFSEFILSKLWDNKEAVLVNGESREILTFGEIAKQAMNLAVSFIRMGVKKGEVVAVCTENRREFWSTVIGISCTGAVVTMINPGYSKGEMNHVMSISKPKYIICSPKAFETHANTLSNLKHIKKIIIYGDDRTDNVLLYNDLVKPVIDDLNGGKKDVDHDQFQVVDIHGQNDTIFILYSSGTTGLPKGVMITHLNMLIMSAQPEDTDVETKVLTITPWYHAMGLVGSFLYFTAGRSIVYLPKYEPELYLSAIEKYQIKQITVVPPILVALSKYPIKHDVSSIKVIYCGAAPLKSDTIVAVCAKFPNVDTVRQGYGLTETTLAVTKTHVDAKPKIGSVGLVVKTTTLKIVDIESRKPLGKHQEGELCIKGPLIMKGYIGKDRKEDFDEEDFFKTGDIGYYDEEGYVFIVGRLKELIKYKGFQVAPAELEGVLLQHDGILDVGVIGVPDADAGEVPMAFVVQQPGVTLTENEVKQFVAEKLSKPKHLRGGVRFVPEIPKNPSGKILRNRLREMVKSSKSKL